MAGAIATMVSWQSRTSSRPRASGSNTSPPRSRVNMRYRLVGNRRMLHRRVPRNLAADGAHKRSIALT